VMSNKHLKFKVKQNDIVLDMIGFNMLSELENIYFNRKNLRLAYYIEENYWAGKKTVQLRLKGIA
jgi:single-stranded-DNA-specific exonuclease